MPLFRQEPRPITYLFSSDNFRQTTITNAQTNETYWIEKYPESLLLWKSPSAKNGSLPMILVATIGLHTAWPGLQHVTYNGERKGMLSMFPSKYWEDRRWALLYCLALIPHS
ncbi:hypothetical protein DL93DRAFT_2080525 [Clavulina sp. PMI_390]|nr:hypothetical protein DL93DRAFT_2080525 [Clavulina sp. PMI_390]